MCAHTFYHLGCFLQHAAHSAAMSAECRGLRAEQGDVHEFKEVRQEPCQVSCCRRCLNTGQVQKRFCLVI